MTMSLSTGLISGMDTGALVSQLIAAEAAPQTALKARLKSAQSAASAYRTVNTTFVAVRAAAEAAHQPRASRAHGPPRARTRTSPSSATAPATKGSKVTFTVTALASTQTLSPPNVDRGHGRRATCTGRTGPSRSTTRTTWPWAP